MAEQFSAGGNHSILCDKCGKQKIKGMPVFPFMKTPRKPGQTGIDNGYCDCPQ